LHTFCILVLLITEIPIIMTNLKIKEIIGSSNAILRSSGLSLYNVISSEIKSNTKLVVDFSEIDNLTSGFCNASFGKLAMEIENFKDLIILENIGNTIFEEKINNSLRHSQLHNTTNFKTTDKAILDLFN
jgi:hypothetical protein